MDRPPDAGPPCNVCDMAISLDPINSDRSCWPNFRGSTRDGFVGLVYADHNRRRAVRSAIAAELDRLSPDGSALNVGAGATSLDPRVRNLDMHDGPNIDYVGRAERIPVDAASVDLVITQETLEHVVDPVAAIREIARVLKPGGRLYLQVPFTIGYHPGPSDYWRFTKEGIVELAESSGLRCETVGIVVGPSTGFYRIAVEFVAILGSLPARVLYIPLKAALAGLLYPLKWLDPVMMRSPQADGIGGLSLLAHKD